MLMGQKFNNYNFATLWSTEASFNPRKETLQGSLSAYAKNFTARRYTAKAGGMK